MIPTRLLYCKEVRIPRFQTYGMSLALFEPEREVSVARIFRSPAILNCVNNVYVDSECSLSNQRLSGAQIH